MGKLNTLSTQGQRRNKFKIHNTWIYLTERCNLNCDYCFFKHRHGRDVSMEAIQQLFLLFERQAAVPDTLIFSGGEVFLAKDKLFKVLNEAHRRFKKLSLHIQTNGLLVDQESIDRLKAIGVTLEFGIDGTPQTTSMHRRGLNLAAFKKLTGIIERCLKAGLGCGSTMTVHPDEAGGMQENFEFLKQLGIPHVDITPAAFMPWSRKMINLFKKNYLALIRRPEFRQMIYANEDHERIKPGMMDLSLHPPGYLLGGDPFLCLPEDKRMKFNLWDSGLGSLKPTMLAFYQKAYAKMFHKEQSVSYRELVCHNFELINKMMGEEYINARPINEILRFLNRTHLTLGISYGSNKSISQ